MFANLYFTLYKKAVVFATAFFYIRVMVTIEKASSLLLKLHEVEESVHWERPAFRANKKIFATIWPLEKILVLKFSVEQQYVYVKMDALIFSAVPGAWGKKGYTCVALDKISHALFSEVIAIARQSV